MGGNPKQPLTAISQADHTGAGGLHPSMNRFLQTQVDDFGNHMRPLAGNSGAVIRQNFSRSERLQALGDFYRGPGAQYSQAARDFFGQHPGL